MAKFLCVAEVEDAVKWEAGFRTHGELFRSQAVSKIIQFGFSDGNKVAIIFEPEDMDFWLKTLDSPETAEAMANDGVKRETVQFFVLDKEFTP